MNNCPNTPKVQDACEFHHPLFHQSGRHIIRKIRRNSKKTDSSIASTHESLEQMDTLLLPQLSLSPTEVQQKPRQLSQELIWSPFQRIKSHPSPRQHRPTLVLPSESPLSSISQQGSYMSIPSLLSSDTQIYCGTNTLYDDYHPSAKSSASILTRNCDITGTMNERSTPSDGIWTNPGTQRRSLGSGMDTDNSSRDNDSHDESPSTDTRGKQHTANNQGDRLYSNRNQKQKGDLPATNMTCSSFEEHLRQFKTKADRMNIELSKVKAHLKNQRLVSKGMILQENIIYTISCFYHLRQWTALPISYSL